MSRMVLVKRGKNVRIISFGSLISGSYYRLKSWLRLPNIGAREAFIQAKW